MLTEKTTEQAGDKLAMATPFKTSARKALLADVDGPDLETIWPSQHKNIALCIFADLSCFLHCLGTFANILMISWFSLNRRSKGKLDQSWKKPLRVPNKALKAPRQL